MKGLGSRCVAGLGLAILSALLVLLRWMQHEVCGVLGAVPNCCH